MNVSARTCYLTCYGSVFRGGENLDYMEKKFHLSQKRNFTFLYNICDFLFVVTGKSCLSHALTVFKQNNN